MFCKKGLELIGYYFVPRNKIYLKSTVLEK